MASRAPPERSPLHRARVAAAAPSPSGHRSAPPGESSRRRAPAGQRPAGGYSDLRSGAGDRKTAARGALGRSRVRNAWIAQLVEQGTENPRVPGSIPGPGTSTSSDIRSPADCKVGGASLFLGGEATLEPAAAPDPGSRESGNSGSPGSSGTARFQRRCWRSAAVRASADPPSPRREPGERVGERGANRAHHERGQLLGRLLAVGLESGFVDMRFGKPLIIRDRVGRKRRWPSCYVYPADGHLGRLVLIQGIASWLGPSKRPLRGDG